MKSHIFFGKYAGTPIEMRTYPIILHIWENEKGRKTASYTNLQEIYLRLKENPDMEIPAPVEAFLNDSTLSKS